MVHLLNSDWLFVIYALVARGRGTTLSLALGWDPDTALVNSRSQASIVGLTTGIMLTYPLVAIMRMAHFCCGALDQRPPTTSK